MPLFVALLCIAARPYAVDAVVKNVHDGDTITVEISEARHAVRLASIDAPELRQDGGQASRRVLAGLIDGQPVQLVVRSRDRYGRLVADVLCGGVNINHRLVADGWAWWYRDYAADDAELCQLESEARGDRRGLWADEEAAPPWCWRHR